MPFCFEVGIMLVNLVYQKKFNISQCWWQTELYRYWIVSVWNLR